MRPEDYLALCRDAIQSVDREVPVFGAKTLEERLAEDLARPRFYTTAVLFFGGFALLLALIGIYGVASYSITQRTHEIGVRIAVGASAQRIRRLLVWHGLLPVAAGVAIGLGAAIGLRRFLDHLMETTKSQSDALTLASAGVLLSLIAAAAAWTATRRVTRMDPIEILRAE